MILTNMAGAGYESDKFYQENDVKSTKSDCVSSEEKNSKTESARFFSEDEDVKQLTKTSFCCSRVL